MDLVVPLPLHKAAANTVRLPSWCRAIDPRSSSSLSRHRCCCSSRRDAIITLLSHHPPTPFSFPAVEGRSRPLRHNGSNHP
ncbi:hypothetical protein E2562_016730 [Oryza meyeriana var. granulata]|uniref:Uncharacterized protein n=1 Tax=Oryza meyeriana var. granulata TaxID=110450 RepID=A0A6G1BYI9_9ORYZ|nr:hypothetical protein E2562_016730 [Oryza meyeriana var. granulata]